MGELYIPKITNAVIRREGYNVQVIKNGRLVFDIPWQAADDLARAITAKAREAEEEFKALKIIEDNALLMRSGAPFGLTRRVDMIRETLKEALHSRKLRRFLPGGIRSKAAIGSPTIIKH